MVTDDNGCTFEKEFTIADTLSPLIVNFVSQDSVSCFGGADGSLEVSASGARYPYQYRVDGLAWQSSGQFTNLSEAFIILKLEIQMVV